MIYMNNKKSRVIKRSMNKEECKPFETLRNIKLKMS